MTSAVETDDPDAIRRRRLADDRRPPTGGELCPDCLESAVRRLGQTVAAAGAISSRGLAASVQSVLDCLVREVIPHLQAEHEVLHPRIERALGRAGVTALEAESIEIRMQIERLGSLAWHLDGASIGRPELRALARTLARLHLLLRRHLDLESALCLEARAKQPDLEADWACLSSRWAECELRARATVVLVVQPVVPSQAAIVLRRNPDLTRAYAVSLADLDHDSERGVPS